MIHQDGHDLDFSMLPWSNLPGRRPVLVKAFNVIFQTQTQSADHQTNRYNVPVAKTNQRIHDHN